MFCHCEFVILCPNCLLFDLFFCQSWQKSKKTGFSLIGKGRAPILWGGGGGGAVLHKVAVMTGDEYCKQRGLFLEMPLSVNYLLNCTTPGYALLYYFFFDLSWGHCWHSMG